MRLLKKLLNIFLLHPFSVLWENVYKIRRSFFEYGVLKKSYFKVPIISIGNLTFGGTGKTPLIIWLLDKIESFELEPVVLTRGYKGKLEHSTGMIRGGQKFLSNPHEFGDEPLLISKKMKSGAVIVGKKRANNLKQFFHEIEPDVVLLDDGFQHLQLHRSLNILIFDALLPLESYKTAPLGYLREGLTALKDADVVLISRADQVEEETIDSLLRLLSPYLSADIILGKFYYIPTGIFDGFEKLVMQLEDIKGMDIIALTAIASPESFYRLLEDHGANIVDKVVFSDHHFFGHEDINDILMKSAKHDALVITSEKDMVKIRKVTRNPKILCVNIEIEFQSGEKDLLDKVKSTLNLDYH